MFLINADYTRMSRTNTMSKGRNQLHYHGLIFALDKLTPIQIYHAEYAKYDGANSQSQVCNICLISGVYKLLANGK